MIDKLNIKSSKELIELIMEGNEYKIISKELGDLICKNKIINNRIDIYISYPDLFLYFNKDDCLYLSYNDNIDNIINKKSYCNFQKKKFEKEIKEYNNFQNKIIEELKKKNNKNIKHDGCLVDKKWINEWKKITHYDNYFSNNILDKSDITKQLLFDYQEEDMKKLISKIKLFHFKSRTEMRNINEDISFVIINDSFYHLITKKHLEVKYKLSFTCSDGIITIFINKRPQEFISSNNIIESKKEKNNVKENIFEIKEKEYNNKNNIDNNDFISIEKNNFDNNKNNYGFINLEENNFDNNKDNNDFINLENNNIDNNRENNDIINLENNNIRDNNDFYNIEKNNIYNNKDNNDLINIENNNIYNNKDDNNFINIENNSKDNNKDNNDFINIENNNINNNKDNNDFINLENNNINNSKDNNDCINLDFKNNIFNELKEELNNNIINNENNNNLNNQNNKPNKKKVLDIKNFFKCCPNIGLQNIGATCYMNATLQCFCHIKNFVNFFKYNPQVNNINKNSNVTLSSSFKLLIEQLWPDDYDFNSQNNKYYAPEEFKKKISKMNPLFEGIAANDAKDLVNFIIMTLHEELNKAEKKNDIYDINVDQTNKELIFNNFAKDFMDKNKSIISDIFYSINCSITECLNCHVKIYNYQTYFYMTFPLEEVRKFKNQNNINNINQYNYFNNYMINNDDSVNLYDCFNYDRKQNIMSGDNSMYCNYCKKTSASSMYANLVTGPEILVLLLNRGKGIQFNVKINFQEDLNLYEYIEFKNTGFNYKLIGVITHIGESSMNGHFIAFCKDPITEKWFKYNDAIVTEINNFQKEVINFCMPYLLFYQKIN